MFRVLSLYVLGFSLFVGRVGYSSPEAVQQLNCLAQVLGVLQDRIITRMTGYEVEHVVQRVRNRALNGRLRDAIPSLNVLLVKPESQISPAELDLLREIHELYNDNEFGFAYFAGRIERKIQSVEFFLTQLDRGMSFTRKAEKDLRRLATSVRRRVEETIIPRIALGEIEGEYKSGFDNTIKVYRFHAQNNYYRLAYRITEEGYEILKIGTRQNFYDDLRRRL